MAVAASNPRDHRAAPEKPMESSRGDTVAEEEILEPTVTPEQLKKEHDRSYGKILLKIDLMKSEGKMVNQSCMNSQEW